MVMAGITSLVIGLWIGPYIIERLRLLKASQSIRTQKEVGELANKHASKIGTPSMGGIILLVAIVGSTLLWAKPNPYVLTSMIVFIGLAAVGFADDYLKISKRNSKGLDSKYKLFWQAVITVICMALLLGDPETHLELGELWVPFIKDPVTTAMPLWVIPVFFFLVMAGSSNAINLTDGVDGLAIGCTITSSMAFAIMSYAAGNFIISRYLLVSYIPGTGELAVICSVLVGASLAFLWFNANKAEVFMGDTGSLALGGLIGTIAFLIHQPFTLVIVGGVFVIEALSVIIQICSFKLTGKRVFKMAPIHHHFELMDIKEAKLVIRFWIVSFLFAIAGLVTLKLR